MVFNIRSLFPARRSVGLPGASAPLIDSNTLRVVALRASWARDHSVARRRLAIRWTLWWIWKFRARLLAACALLAALIYLLYRVGVIGPWMVPLPAAPAISEGGIPLRMDLQLRSLPTDTSPPRQTTPDSQPKIKESSP